jgi:hypothetical protein
MRVFGLLASTAVVVWSLLNWEDVSANWEDVTDNWEG